MNMAPTNDIDALKARAKEDARGVVSFSQRQLDRVVSPSKRRDVYDAASEFAHERPILFVRAPSLPTPLTPLTSTLQAFLLFQVVFSFLPLVTFAVFALSTVALALGSALVFSLFWIGVALLVLVPTLFLTSSIGLLVWLWAAGSFLVARKLWSLAPAVEDDRRHAGGVNGQQTRVVLKDEKHQG